MGDPKEKEWIPPPDQYMAAAKYLSSLYCKMTYSHWPSADDLRHLADLREHFDNWAAGEEDKPLPVMAWREAQLPEKP